MGEMHREKKDVWYYLVAFTLKVMLR